ncbi:restriction endonuclease subunit S [Megamonas funiformis]|uniref:restriction endonuclease subunit S n=1 Tax=Megamonas funiformis TaxID=437897 RepID=UPI001958F09E|nr:restriction endonuclease subunit S [Megamonas funiformis]MBM6726581.1 restriction endonuclease subunit S [Megamonas funiformis]
MNIPKLRFKDNNGNDYPQWEKKKLGDIGNIISGGTPSSSNKEYWNGHINWFTPSEVGKTKFVSESIRKITEKGLKNSSAKLLPKGTILLSSRATIGEKSILLNSATTNQGFQSIITNNEAINEFIYYYIDTLKSELIKQSSGSTFLEISNTILKKLKIYIPNLQEQEKIANFLSTVDKKIENLANTITSLENQKKGLLQQIFSQKLRFKDENGNNYPDWEKKKLGDITQSQGGTALEKYTTTNGLYKFISIGNYSTYSTYLDNGIRIDLNNKTKKQLLNKNDLVMILNDKTSSGNIIGRTLLIDKDNTYIYNQRSQRLICNTKIIIPSFLYFLLNSDFRKNIIKKVQGATQIYINYSTIEVMHLNIPCLEEQTKIADFLSAFDRKLENQKTQLEHWQQIKKGLLQQMFV